MTHNVYRLFNADGDLLYIGSSGNVPARLSSHEHNKEWWGDVASHTITEFPCKSDALCAERDAIDAETPMHNIQRKGRRAGQVTMKQEGNAQDLVTLTVRVTRSQADALKRVADLEDRPVAAELRRLIKRRVAELPEAA